MSAARLVGFRNPLRRRPPQVTESMKAEVRLLGFSHELFVENGLEPRRLHHSPADQTWGLREFAVTDPDGSGLCFCAAIPIGVATVQQSLDAVPLG